MAEKPADIYETAGFKESVWRNLVSKPPLAIATGGLLAIAGKFLYDMRKRQVPLSLHIIEMRVNAQGYFMVALAGSMAFYMIKDMYEKKESKEPDSK